MSTRHSMLKGSRYSSLLAETKLPAPPRIHIPETKRSTRKRSTKPPPSADIPALLQDLKVYMGRQFRDVHVALANVDRRIQEHATRLDNLSSSLTVAHQSIAKVRGDSDATELRLTARLTAIEKALHHPKKKS